MKQFTVYELRRVCRQPKACGYDKSITFSVPVKRVPELGLAALTEAFEVFLNSPHEHQQRVMLTTKVVEGQHET